MTRSESFFLAGWGLKSLAPSFYYGLAFCVTGLNPLAVAGF